MPGRKFPPCEIEGAKRCTKCERVKPLASFSRDPRCRDGLRSDCKACERVKNTILRQAPHRKARERARYDSDAYRAEKLATYYKRRDAALAYARTYRKTPMGRLVHRRCSAARRVRLATTDEQRAAALALVGAYDREIERLRRRLAKEDKAA